MLGLVVAGVLAGCGNLATGKPAAEKAIGRFHQLYNEGKLDQIWQESDPAFRAAATRKKYDDLLNAVERKLGKVTSTSNSGWNVQTLNSRTTVHMSQETVFEKGQGSESFVFSVDGTNAALTGYNIQSMDLITK